MPAASLEGIDIVILAGGLGTRLRPVQPDRQKVLAEVDGRSFLELLLEFLAAAGGKRVILALGYKADQVSSFIQGRDWGKLEIIPSIEASPLGTGGALRFAMEQVHSDTVLVLNGDSFADADLAGFLRFHRAKNAAISMLLVPIKGAGRYGLVETDEKNSVVRFIEKPSESKHSMYINSGIYLFEKNMILDIDTDSEVSLERDVFPQLCNTRFFAMKQDVPFIDIGTPDSWQASSAFFAALKHQGLQE